MKSNVSANVSPSSAVHLSPNMPLLDLVEDESHYLLALDLPNLPFSGAEIDVKKNELQVLVNQQDEVPADTGSISSEMLLRLRSRRKSGIRALYQNGVLWVLLPKFGGTSLGLGPLALT